MKIGVIDWGIGGVDFLIRLQRITSINCIYFSDAGFTPYGKVKEIELRKRVYHVIDFLHYEGCDKIIIACNAASTVIEESENLLGIISAGIEEVKRNKCAQIGLVGGQRTVESKIYKIILENEGIKVNQEIAQPLSALIEMGDLSSSNLKSEVERIFGPLKEEKNILLACTHYRLIENIIKEQLPQVCLLDPVDFLIDKFITTFKDENLSSTINWITTGDNLKMQKVLKMNYNLEVNTIKKVVL